MAGTTMQMQNVSTVSRLFIMFYLCFIYVLTITCLLCLYCIIFYTYLFIYNLFITYKNYLHFFRSLLYSRLTSLGLMLSFYILTDSK